ncbi:hypothetical protein VTK73DRAFT_3209 [Phialemonium thermophilum]|uniref:Secreted protein n=1 Tax=Phialemonium thermophilum TaxID=223376 RepID=A0ABR3VMG1_9PEZI
MRRLTGASLLLCCCALPFSSWRNQRPMAPKMTHGNIRTASGVTGLGKSLDRQMRSSSSVSSRRPQAHGMLSLLRSSPSQQVSCKAVAL